MLSQRFYLYNFYCIVCDPQLTCGSQDDFQELVLSLHDGFQFLKSHSLGQIGNGGGTVFVVENMVEVLPGVEGVGNQSPRLRGPN